MKLVDNLHAYLWPGATLSEQQRYGNNCNTYLFARVLEGKHVLIDPGHVVNELGRKCLDNLLNELEKDEIKAEDIGLIIATHTHSDHCEAIQSFKERSNALITISKVEDRYRKTIGRKMSEAFYKMLSKSEIPWFEPDFYLNEGELNLGEKINLKIYHTPGHSPGHISIYWPLEGVLIVGDVIFNGSTGRVDLPGGSAKALKESIEKLSQLDVEYLLTGHQYGAPGIIKGRENVKRNFEYVRRYVFPQL
ncbi:MAG: MBL fold metallo-hydrolase [Candidatus Aenigmarchaeota archaeon]|nr:MBL fold metallo-hydrolase [Candidatus Aenigmarchaeota archaeon]